MSASAAESNVIRVSNQKEFEEAIARVNKDSDSEYTIELTADISANGFSIDSSRKATILGNGHTMTMSVYGSIHVSKGAELTLGAADGNVLNIRSAKGTSNDEPGVLKIEGTCNMYSGVTLSGRGKQLFRWRLPFPAAPSICMAEPSKNVVLREAPFATAAVLRWFTAVSLLWTAERSKNATQHPIMWIITIPLRCFMAMVGGVIVSGGSSFVMNGGSVSNNSATNMGGGVAVAASYEEDLPGWRRKLKSSVEILGGKVEKKNARRVPVFLRPLTITRLQMRSAPTHLLQALRKSRDCMLKTLKFWTIPPIPRMEWVAVCGYPRAKSPAAASIENATVKGNKAATGAGTASYGYYTNMNIKGCTITENIANKYGGGFAAEDNKSGGKNHLHRYNLVQ